MKFDSSLQNVKGVGEKTAQALAKYDLRTIQDMIEFLPRRYSNFAEEAKITDLQAGNVLIRAKCQKISTKTVRRGMKITTAVLYDDSGKLEAVWFNQPYREKQLQNDKWFLFSGQFNFQYNKYQLSNPSVELASEITPNHNHSSKIMPIYRKLKGIPPSTIYKIMQNIKGLIEFLPETMPLEILQKQKLISLAEAFLQLHFPETDEQIVEARTRLAFDELFEMLVASQLNKQSHTQLKGWKITFNQPIIQDFVKNLPFKLTKTQKIVTWQILQDLESSKPMNRLLQGDVGSGKTVVSGIAARQVADAKMQTAIMAPTAILAQQHLETLAKLLNPCGVTVELLTSSVKGKARKDILERLENGQIDIIVGTHALIEDPIKYHKLGLVVIDEQHRFGVAQRQALLQKSSKMPHLLSMTATPIPRSLTLTLYGELDISIINELPAGRQPITTKIWSPVSSEKLYQTILQELQKGRQAYIICPLIDDNPDNDKKSVEDQYRRLKSTIFRDQKVGLLHGKLKSDEKERVMQDFADHKIDILISTTVVEVGVNVPNATVMLIENADHFGLSQLHQLRGRVGRGEHKSYCYLMMSDYSKPSQRLREIEKSQDGFYLAEVDLKLRGGGEIYGKSQHGALNLKIATLADTQLIARAKNEAVYFVKNQLNLSDYPKLNTAVKKYQKLTVLN